MSATPARLISDDQMRITLGLSDAFGGRTLTHSALGQSRPQHSGRGSDAAH